MPIVELLASPAGPAVRVEGEGPLVDVCDQARAPVELSCRDGNCGTCRVEVVTGEALLEPPGAGEVALLQRLAARPGQRLACQAVVRSGPGILRLRWLGR